jgi:hypothetical protein
LVQLLFRPVGFRNRKAKQIKHLVGWA